MRPVARPGPVWIVGAGRVGTSLALSLRDAGFPVLLVLRRPVRRELPVPARMLESLTPPAAGTAVVILAVPDRSILDAAERVVGQMDPSDRLVLGHLSGVVPSCRLALSGRHGAIGRFSAHPLHAFPATEPAVPVPPGVPFLVEGDETGVAIARALILAIDGVPIPIDPDRKPLAHGAAVLAANLPAELVFSAADVFRDLGVPDPDRVAVRLFRSLVDNLENRPSPFALTGPLVRGDVATVQANLEALQRWSSSDRDVRSLYRRISRRLLLRLRRMGFPGAEGTWRSLREWLR